MYCGTLLPPAEVETAAQNEAVSPERARELLAGLTAEARSMMPPATLATLKAAAEKAPPKKASGAPKSSQRSSGPPVVRPRLGFTGLGRRGTTTSSLPPVKGPTPVQPPTDLANIPTDGPVPRERAARPPAVRKTTRPGGQAPPVPAPPPPSADADLPEDPPTLERMRAVEDDSIQAISTAALRPLDTGEMDALPISTAAIRPLDTGEMDALPISTAAIRPLDSSELDAIAYESSEMEALPADAFSSFHDLQAVSEAPAAPDVGPITAALMRGGGPFGPRDHSYRLILLPEEEYRSKVHWLRHRLADTTGADLYTAAQMLNKEVPAFLFGSDDEAEVYERAEHLRAGGLSVLVLDPSRRRHEIEPLYVTSADGAATGPVSFTTAGGAVIEVKRGGFAWACLGNIEPDGDRSARVRDRSFTGRTVPDRPTFDAAAGPYVLLDLFLTLATQPIRLRSDRFDFGCLGPARELAATLNLRKMLSWLSPDPSTPLPLDERFKRVAHLRVAASQGGDGDLAVPQRELEFTEYGMIVNAQHRRATTA
jgi:hypothetical protein